MYKWTKHSKKVGRKKIQEQTQSNKRKNIPRRREEINKIEDIPCITTTKNNTIESLILSKDRKEQGTKKYSIRVL